jgi:carboxypeptidase C (cathepsin A)
MALLPTAYSVVIITLFVFLLADVEGVRRLPNEINSEPTFRDHGRRLTSDGDTEQFSRVTDSDDPDSHLVTSLPLLPDGAFKSKHWAGHIPASSDGDKKLFYWLFEPSSGVQSDDTPLILWLNGGPGCSSMDGLWLENGPLRLNSEGGTWKIDVNKFSWHNAPAWALYVDQPVG